MPNHCKRLALGLALLLSVSAYTQAAYQDFRLRDHQLSMAAVTSEDVDAEIKFGRGIAARILGRLSKEQNPERHRYVNLVGRSLAQHANRPEIDFRFAVLEADFINAYSAPGGYIFITSRAVDIMQDEAELAAVLAHEIAHVTERHIVNQLNIRGSETSGLSSVTRLVGSGQDTARVALSQAIDKAVTLLFETGFKHEDEMGSDHVALLLLASSGYDAGALKRYLIRAQELSQEHENEQKTHPTTGHRLTEIDRLVREEGLLDLQGTTAKKRFDQYVKNNAEN